MRICITLNNEHPCSYHMDDLIISLSITCRNKSRIFSAEAVGIESITYSWSRDRRLPWAELIINSALRLSHCPHQAKNMKGEGKDNATYFSRPQSPCPVAAIEGCVVSTRSLPQMKDYPSLSLCLKWSIILQFDHSIPGLVVTNKKKKGKPAPGQDLNAQRPLRRNCFFLITTNDQLTKNVPIIYQN